MQSLRCMHSQQHTPPLGGLCETFSPLLIHALIKLKPKDCTPPQGMLKMHRDAENEEASGVYHLE